MKKPITTGVIFAIICVSTITLLSSFDQSLSQSDSCPQGTKTEVRGTEIICIPISNAERTCPIGTYQGLDNQGNFACRDVETNQIIDPDTGLMMDSQTGEIILDDSQMRYVGIGVFILFIIIAGLALASRKKSESESYKDVERKHFTPNTKERVKELQHGRCADCGKIPTHWEFDHIDTRGDNSIENCQGLCLDCHQSKTRKDDWSNSRD